MKNNNHRKPSNHNNRNNRNNSNNRKSFNNRKKPNANNKTDGYEMYKLQSDNVARNNPLFDSEPNIAYTKGIYHGIAKFPDKYNGEDIESMNPLFAIMNNKKIQFASLEISNGHVNKPIRNIFKKIGARQAVSCGRTTSVAIHHYFDDSESRFDGIMYMTFGKMNDKFFENYSDINPKEIIVILGEIIDDLIPGGEDCMIISLQVCKHGDIVHIREVDDGEIVSHVIALGTCDAEYVLDFIDRHNLFEYRDNIQYLRSLFAMLNSGDYKTKIVDDVNNTEYLDDDDDDDDDDEDEIGLSLKSDIA